MSPNDLNLSSLGEKTPSPSCKLLRKGRARRLFFLLRILLNKERCMSQVFAKNPKDWNHHICSITLSATLLHCCFANSLRALTLSSIGWIKERLRVIVGLLTSKSFILSALKSSHATGRPRNWKTAPLEGWRPRSILDSAFLPACLNVEHCLAMPIFLEEVQHPHLRQKTILGLPMNSQRKSLWPKVAKTATEAANHPGLDCTLA